MSISKSDSTINDNTAKIKLEENEVKERETWVGKFDFFLTALGYAVGLGAVWRFPYLCYKNGGGAFLVPYFVFLILCGIPMVFLEMSVGQFTSSGPCTCWVMSNLFRGIGFSVNTVNNYVNVYFTMILAYSLVYLVRSFTTQLPWQKCHPDWPENCVDDFSPGKFNFTNCLDTSRSLKCDNGICYSSITSIGTIASCETNRTILNKIGYWKPQFPSQIFWNDRILQKSSGIEESGKVVWELLLGLFVAWLIVLGMVIKGIKVSGKLVYFTCLFPYVVLLILGIRGWLLEGAGIGIKYYIYPDFSKLKDIRVWSDAAAQIFFTLNVSYGGLIALSSYNKFRTNILRDAIAVSIGNCATSIYAGFVVFAYIGHLSVTTGQDIDKVVQAGQGLAFVVYPYAVTTIPGAPFWAIMFFFMMLVLGLDSTMGSIETFITSVFDLFPKLKQTNWIRYVTIIVIVAIFFLLGILFTIQSGTYWLEIFNEYSGSWSIFIIAILECISVNWFYGFKNFRNDISAMIGPKIANHKLFNIFRALWCVITPAIILALAVLSFMSVKNIESNGYKFPYWTLIFGNFLCTLTLLGIIIWPIYLVIDALYINKRPLKTLLKPSKNWRPLKEEDRLLVELAHGRIPDQSIGKENEMFEATESF